jgi:hypothetical protein
MAEITPSRIESISDPNPGPQDQPAPKPRTSAAAAGKPAPPHVPEISATDEDDKHELDEMA